MEQGMTEAVKKVCEIAGEEAARSNHSLIEREHLMIGILSLEKVPIPASGEDSFKKEAMAIQDILYGIGGKPQLNMPPSRFLRRTIRRLLGSGDAKTQPGTMRPSPSARAAFRRAGEIAGPGNRITCLHVIAAIVEDPSSVIKAALEEMGASVDDMAIPVSGWIALLGQDGNANGPFAENSGLGVASHARGIGHSEYLDIYCRDLTREASEGELGPYLERRKELLQMVRTLRRHKRNNPVLVGKAGVGKTALVESLAIRIAGPGAPGFTGDKRLLELNMASLIANTKLRGDMEGRLTRILDEAVSAGNVIIFIDGINSIAGKGAGDGASMDVAGILKPYLERGLKCIGTSTLQDYQGSIGDNPTLERLFEPILVGEPGRGETLEMLKVWRMPLEKHYGVFIPDQALEASVDLSMRFDAGHHLPDKAVRLLDTACADALITTLNPGPIEASLKEVTGPLVAETMAARAGLPLEIVTGHLEGKPLSLLLGLQPFLSSSLVGQDRAIDRVYQRLSIAYAGLEKRKGPLAVFLFMGPSGVGKTKMAKLLAEYFFGNGSDMIRLDMSEFSEANSVARLIGAPPGYVGYGDGQLVRMLREKRHAVVLFDEVEKANPRIFDVFLQLFDEGYITDSMGRTADARNAIFIMTSNLEPDGGLSYDEVENSGSHRVRRMTEKKRDCLKMFRRELLNRIDEIIVFNALDYGAILEILEGMVREKMDELNKKEHVTLSVSDEAMAFIAAAGYRPEDGARALERAVSRFLCEPLSSLILTRKIKEHPRWQAIYDERGVSIVPDE